MVFTNAGAGVGESPVADSDDEEYEEEEEDGEGEDGRRQVNEILPHYKYPQALRYYEKVRVYVCMYTCMCT